jgi:UDP-N-acetyl-D-glucosamine dehydrogenase
VLPADLVRLRSALDRGTLTLHDDPGALEGADAVVICVPTPIDRHLAPDIRALRAACATAVAAARPGQVIVLTSTSYVGTTRDLLLEPLRARGLRPGADLAVAFSPERIDPGNAGHPQHAVPRVVGGYTVDCGSRAATVMAQVAPTVHLVSSPEAAEFVKLYENTFRAVNIAFANEMADVARGLGLDVVETIDAAATKPYGFMPFTPGPGVGGHCIPCDPHYLLWQLRAQRQRPSLVDEAMAKIASRPGQVVARAVEVLGDRGRPVRGARVLVVGVAYKPGVQDVRESPALEVLTGLAHRGAEVAYTDPYAPEVTVAGTRLRSEDRAEDGDWDLVIVNTLHPDVDPSWLRDVPAVLDASFRMPRSLPCLAL